MPRTFGIGAQLGTFSGVTGKVYMRARHTAVDFALGTAYGHTFSESVHAHVTFHEHFGPIVEGSGVTIPWRLGIGGWFNGGSNLVFPKYEDEGMIVGARAPIGLDFDLEDVPVQLFVEVALDLALVPGIAATFDASIGGRYYF